MSRGLLHPLGHRVYVEGLGVRRIEDLMRRGLARTVDVYVATEKEAREFGRRAVRVVELPE